MIRRLLIANRGEIAVRIARTCRRLGIESVALYSEAERRALHVRAADFGRFIGPAEPARSYLDGPAIVSAARATAAGAIHPGYGFLSENAEFAETCGAAGLIFVGPSPRAIREMGSKERSRALAQRIGVPTVPGYHGAAQDDEALASEADQLGYPLLVKASAGGGGKGIRLVERPGDLAAALATARREATSAFGDAALVLERYLERARHVEVQVLGDHHGRRVHLYDRECSIQRLHQKLIEEAPAPRLSDRTRQGLRDAALRIAEAIDYDSVGTVEFLVDECSGQFFFLEMNTRLQVEHPTTELVSGVDLVELQIAIACGERLPAAIGFGAPRGSAIEARICAERPEEGFLPATGAVRAFEVPAIDGVRVDSGIDVGSEVTPFYDSMLAKVVAHGASREEARRKLVAALGRTVLSGVDSNLDFLRDVLETDGFRAAEISTRFLEPRFETQRPTEDEGRGSSLDRITAALSWMARIERQRRGSVPAPWDRLGPWRVTRRAGRGAWTAVVLRAENGETREVRLAQDENRYQIEDGVRSSVEAWWQAAGDLRLEIDGTLHRRRVDLVDDTIWVSGGTRHRRFLVVSREAEVATREAGASADPRNLVAPFPGLVTSVEISRGDRVEPGSLLVVMEAMKMVHSLRAAGSGAVREIHCSPGRTVTAGELLVEFEPGGA
jgi:acetyl/propionyl-CoA carboxylase alpha subunit